MPTNQKYGAGGRKVFVRTRVPNAERVASVIILLLVAVIGWAIYHKGKRFDPNRYAVRTDALKSTIAAVAGKAGTVPTEVGVASTIPAKTATAEAAPSGALNEDSSAESSSDGHDAAPKPATKGQPLELTLAGTKPMGDTEFYNSDNLYEKIDGRAPAYQNFNVQMLRCRSFAVNAAPGSYVDVYEYQFDSPVDAFGMFSMERDPNGNPLTNVPDGYSGEMGYFFRQGAVYVQIIASDTKPATLAIAKSIADIRAKDLPVNDAGLAGRRKLPADGLISDSVSFVPENAQGQSTFKDVFQAKYKFEGSELPFFIMVAATEESEKAWSAYQAFCSRFGKLENLADVNGGKMFTAQVFGKWKVAYLRDGELGGVFDAADAVKARSFVEKYLRGEIK